MTSKIIKEFNEIMEYFLIQTIPIIGNTYHFRFKQIIQTNSILPMEQFLVHILPKRDMVINKDESLFTNKQSDIINNIDDTDIISKIFTLQDVYDDLSRSSKDNIWDFFQAMLILGEDYIKLTHNHLQK